MTFILTNIHLKEQRQFTRSILPFFLFFLVSWQRWQFYKLFNVGNCNLFLSILLILYWSKIFKKIIGDNVDQMDLILPMI